MTKMINPRTALSTHSDAHVLVVLIGDLAYKGDVFKDGVIELNLTDKKTNKRVRKTFKGEMAHWDAERWLNDQVGWPNPFAGIFTTGAFI